MYRIWDSGSARIYSYDRNVHDFGACTVRQLLFGYDEDLETRLSEQGGGGGGNGGNDGDDEDDDDHYETDYSDDFFSYNDGSNPCLQNQHYVEYLEKKYAYYEQRELLHWDYIFLNDNTRSPARAETRREGLDVLESAYLPWFLETGATPVFLDTYAYWTPYRDMGGLVSVPEFTSLTYAGYQEYADMLSEHLPANQKPRIAPVGLAFLLVWEENQSFWERLFHVDKIHASPLGTYLQGCVVHHTLFGVLPDYRTAVRGDMSSLWINARRFQPGEHRRSPFPSRDEAAYLYNVAARICVYGHVPKTFVRYTEGEASNYAPIDDQYKVDDLF
jgi:hypothetical protein